MEEFFTRKKANEGVQLPLTLPNGELSDHWVRVRGIDSDAFRKTESEEKSRAYEYAQITSQEKKIDALRKGETRCVAALISEWSFPQECNEENKTHFLREAPQVADAINRFAAQRHRFFQTGSASSTNGQHENLNSAESQPVQNNPSDSI